MSADGLVAPFDAFVQAVTASLGALGADEAEALATAEAMEVVTGFIDADGRHTDDELRALVVAAGRWSGTQLAQATPADVRAAGIVSGRRAFLEQVSPLFALLADADARDGTQHSWQYYRGALDIGHAVAAIDVHTSQAELDAIARHRAVMLAAIRARGVARPPAAFFGGHPLASPPPETGTPATATDTAAPEVAQPATPPEPLEELLAELDELVGLEPVKAEVRVVADLLAVNRLRRERGLGVAESSRHLIFTGNPGTGKTTVARLLSRIYRSLGVVARGHLVETDRASLVAGYVGQTAERTKAVIESALDGTLLIDEAYALARGSDKDFGREAIDTLVKEMEDHRERLVVVACGYPDEMATFLGANPGLTSRFPKTIHFPDYTTEELVRILVLIAGSRQYALSDEGRAAAAVFFDAQPRDRGFGNGRLARNLFEAAMARQASRLVALDDPTDEQLVTLDAGDLAGVDLGAR